MSDTPQWLLDKYGSYADELSDSDCKRMWQDELESTYGSQATEDSEED